MLALLYISRGCTPRGALLSACVRVRRVPGVEGWVCVCVLTHVVVAEMDMPMFCMTRAHNAAHAKEGRGLREVRPPARSTHDQWMNA